MNPKTVTIIIPTHNRCEVLLRTLSALRGQSYPPAALEVIVVADGCSDDSAACARSFEAPFAIRALDQPGRGAAAARNAGARAARGQLLIFLDDDVEPLPNLVSAHVEAHGTRPNRVAIGYLHHVLDGADGFLPRYTRIWWHDAIRALHEPGRRHTYRSLLSGNFSIRSELFHAVGGFDEQLPCREDYELGARLIDARAEFVAIREAGAVHQLRPIPESALARARLEGRADVMIARKHPRLRPTMEFLDDERGVVNSRSYRFARRFPQGADLLMRAAARVIGMIEYFRMWSRWRRSWDRLRQFAYVRGVAEMMDSRPVEPFSTASETDVLEIDLADGIDAAEAILDRRRPSAVRLRYAQFHVGSIPAEPGAEPLRGTHLRPFLSGGLARRLLVAMAAEPERAGVHEDVPAEKQETAAAIPLGWTG